MIAKIWNLSVNWREITRNICRYEREFEAIWVEICSPSNLSPIPVMVAPVAPGPHSLSVYVGLVVYHNLYGLLSWSWRVTRGRSGSDAALADQHGSGGRTVCWAPPTPGHRKGVWPLNCREDIYLIGLSVGSNRPRAICWARTRGWPVVSSSARLSARCCSPFVLVHCPW